jgi:hypothetical protein
VFPQREDVTSTVCSSERWTAFVVVIRRFVLLVGFLLTGFVIASCWSTTASADERGNDEVPQPVYDQLVAAVVENVTETAAGPVELGAVDDVHELVDIHESDVVRESVEVLETVDRDEIPALSQAIMTALDAMGVNVVDDQVAHLLGATPGDLATVIDTMAYGDTVYEASAASPRMAELDSVVVERGSSSAVVTLSTVTPGSGAVDLVPTMSFGATHVKAVDAVAVSHVDGAQLSNQVPSGVPTAPFAATGTGGGTSTVSSSGGSATGAIVPGGARHDDVLAASGVTADGIYPVRRLANVPQVFPA